MESEQEPSPSRTPEPKVPRLKFSQLVAFEAVARTGSVSRAAALLNTTQPPLSRQIAALERCLGVSLFERGNKGMTLNEIGERLLHRTQPILQDLRMLQEEIQSEQNGTGGRLSVGCVYSNAPLVLELLNRYHTLRPNVELFIRQGTPEDLLSELKQARLHVLFLRDWTVRMPGYRTRVLGEDPLELIMRRETDPAPGLDSVPLEQLRNVPMCLLPQEDRWNYTERLVVACQDAGFSPLVVCQCYDTPMAMQLVRAGLGVTFLPRSIVANQTGDVIYSKPVTGLNPVTRPTLIWNSDPCLPACIPAFVNLVCTGTETAASGAADGSA